MSVSGKLVSFTKNEVQLDTGKTERGSDGKEHAVLKTFALKPNCRIVNERGNDAKLLSIHHLHNGARVELCGVLDEGDERDGIGPESAGIGVHTIIVPDNASKSGTKPLRTTLAPASRDDVPQAHPTDPKVKRATFAKAEGE